MKKNVYAALSPGQKKKNRFIQSDLKIVPVDSTS